MPQDKKTNLLSTNISFGRVGLREKAIFARNLSVMLRSGLTIAESLDILADQAVGRLRQAILSMMKSVAAGNSLSSALSKFSNIFSSFFINAVRAGESSGTLEGNLGNIADQLTKEKELFDKIRSAMFYPAVVLILSFILGAILSFVVLPKITPLFTGFQVELPLATRLLIGFSGIVEKYGLAIFTSLVAVTLFFIWLSRQKFIQPLTHWLFLHLPIIGKMSHYRNLAQFNHVLGVLLKSGLSIDEALKIAENTVGNHYYKKCLSRVRKRVSQGIKVSDALEDYNQYFPKMAVSMIRVGEKSGNMEEEFFNLAYMYETEVDMATKMLSTAIEPILLIVIGAVVGGLALAIITPIYSITGGVHR